MQVLADHCSSFRLIAIATRYECKVLQIAAKVDILFGTIFGTKNKKLAPRMAPSGTFSFYVETVTNQKKAHFQ
ncbi:hypothetical protein [Paenibacillus pasadenensis]|uniref:hypothetical protein n=1 Tax=Paenibacillus pasadenensis TaxID=217090 RepID=UPI00203B1472|nr:hypothetical protein [Paenibacillus pasadenensis]